MTKRKINLMKTRKYKDNQQRKNFSKNEANLLLKQYFKKLGSVAARSGIENTQLASVAGRSTNKVSELDTKGIRSNNYASQSSIGGSIPVLLKEHQGKKAPQSSSLQALSTMKEKKNNFVADYKQ